jgi:hypothetical protein
MNLRASRFVETLFVAQGVDGIHFRGAIGRDVTGHRGGSAKNSYKQNESDWLDRHGIVKRPRHPMASMIASGTPIKRPMPVMMQD